jgi:hypothetical protein
VVPAASAQDDPYSRAMDLEQGGKYREAIGAFRASLTGANYLPAMLGLERSYAALGWTDSMVAVIDSAIRTRPREAMFRSVQLRTLEVDRLRNLKAVRLALPAGLTLLTGRNGQGKTSLLEAAYLLGTGRSFRARRLEELVAWEGGPLRVAGEVTRRTGAVRLGVVQRPQVPRHVVQGPVRQPRVLGTAENLRHRRGDVGMGSGCGGGL